MRGRSSIMRSPKGGLVKISLLITRGERGSRKRSLDHDHFMLICIAILLSAKRSLLITRGGGGSRKRSLDHDHFMVGGEGVRSLDHTGLK